MYSGNMATVEDISIELPQFIRFNLSTHDEAFGPLFDGAEILNYFLNTSGLSETFGTPSVLTWFERSALMIILLMGFVTNTLTVLVLRTRELRIYNASVYLLALAVTDTVCLSFVLLDWLSDLGWWLLQLEVLCRLSAYMNHVFKFLSVWIVVSFTIERYMAVRNPVSWRARPRRRRVQFLLVLLVLVALSSHVTVLTDWTVLTLPFTNRKLCSPDPTHGRQLGALLIAETLVNLVVPCLLLITANLLICIVARRRLDVFQGCTYGTGSVRNMFLQREISLQKSSPNSPTANITGSQAHPFTFPRAPSRARSSLTLSATQKRVQRRPDRNHLSMNVSHMTRMAFFVSCTFVLLNAPNQALRLYIFIQQYFKHPVCSVHNMNRFRYMKVCFELMHFSTYSINFFLYSMCGTLFRRQLMKLTRRCIRHKSEQTQGPLSRTLLENSNFEREEVVVITSVWKFIIPMPWKRF